MWYNNFSKVESDFIARENAIATLHSMAFRRPPSSTARGIRRPQNSGRSTSGSALMAGGRRPEARGQDNVQSNLGALWPDYTIILARTTRKPMSLHLATREDIMSYFRHLAFQHHPDHGGDPAKFRALVAARDRALKRCRPTRRPLKDHAEEAFRALMAIPLADLLTPPPIPARPTRKSCRA
jgi:hypothetical protein